MGQASLLVQRAIADRAADLSEEDDCLRIGTSLRICCQIPMVPAGPLFGRKAVATRQHERAIDYGQLRRLAAIFLDKRIKVLINTYAIMTAASGLAWRSV
jgi:hypothetical protein